MKKIIQWFFLFFLLLLPVISTAHPGIFHEHGNILDRFHHLIQPLILLALGLLVYFSGRWFSAKKSSTRRVQR